MSLPSGYKRLEYIQSSGKQYINTAFNPNQDTRVVISFEPTQTKTWTGAFGARNATNDSEYGVDFPSGTEIRSVFGSETLSIAISGMLARFDVDKNKNICTINGATITNAAQIFQANYPIWIFDKNTAGAKWSPISMKLYSCQIYDNGTLVRDYIPCQTTSGEIGLWDDVNMLFYGNAGTGAFTAGPVIAIAINKSEITELEYIQGSGTQYINTLFIPKSTSKVVSDFQITEKRSKNNDVFGVVGQFSFRQYANSDFFRTVCGSVADFETSVSILSRHVVEKTMTETKIDGLYSVSTDASTVSNTIFLFAYNAGSYVSNYGYLKLYSCQIYDNGTLIRDYIAAKLSDGTVGLYDKLNSLFYINAGTGTFTAGPVKVSPLNLPVNIGGTWKNANEVFVNIGGTWKTVESAFVNIGGTWKELG